MAEDGGKAGEDLDGLDEELVGAGKGVGEIF